MRSSASFDMQDPYKSLLVCQGQMGLWTRASQESSNHHLMDAALQCNLLSPCR